MLSDKGSKVRVREAFSFTAIMLVAFLPSAKSQGTTGQLWTDFTIQKNISSKYSFENELGLQTGLNTAEKWWSFSTTPELERSVGKRFAVSLSIGLAYTYQQVSYETWEVQPGLSIKYRLFDLKRFQTRLQAKFEQRNLYNIEAKEWDQDSRARFKIECMFVVHGESFQSARYSYALFYAENFWTMDQVLEERYANRLRISAGLGYRVNPTWSFEGSYIYQFSKNTIEGEIQDNQQQIFRLKIKYNAG